MLTYFLQVNLCWLTFYGLYWALLSRETFFKLNRIYLIISLLCGLVVPFATEYMSQMEEVVAMPILQISQPMAQSIEAFQENIEVNMVKTAQTWNLWQILRGCYVVGVLWVLMRFLMGLMKIWKLYQQGFKEKNNDFTLVHCEGLKTPFSFFKWIFIDKTLYDAAVLGQILEHEKAHIHQKHSFDIVGIEILRGVFWMSPLVHLYARSLRNVHEYLADAAVLENTEKKQYGRLLISQSANTSGLIIANHFNFSQLKKRIIMMSRNRSERKALVKYTLAAPLFITLMVLLISPKNGLMAKTEGLNETMTSVVDKIEVKIQNAVIINKNLPSKIYLNQIDTTNKPQNYGFFDPKVRLVGKTEGSINKVAFRSQNFLHLVQPMYDTPMKCNILSFQLIRIPFGSISKQEVKNIGQKFSSETLELIQKAEDGDIYQFINIRGIYPGDDIARYLSNSIFTIGDDVEENFNKYPSEASNGAKEKVPQPFPTLNGFRGGIDLNRFKELDELLPYEQNTFGYFEAISKNLGEIESFTVRKNDEDAISCIGSRFNNKVQDLTQNSKKGDVLRFENIIFKMNSGAKLKWNIGELLISIKKKSVAEWSTRAEWFAKPYAPTHTLKEIPTDVELISCIINHYPKGESKSPQRVNFSGYAWTEEALQLLQKAQIGDMYEFTNIKVKRRGQTNIDDFNAIKYILN